MNNLLFGCVADDFTGASDAASFFLAGGLKTLLLNGIPHDTNHLPDGVKAIVIALKSRTQESSIAVKDSLNAFTLLKKMGCRQLYFKYCSTFDSTPEGNIGPVIDAVLDKYKLPYTIISPALPVNKRTVKNGHLFVNGVPLHKSSMKDHPLTPMWDSDLNNLIAAQGKYRSFNLDYSLLEKNRVEIFEKIFNYKSSIGNNPFYIITDYFKDKHGEIIADLFRDLPFLTG
ncbi:MAG: four-carbon acid sugar kinase family protein, partial [Spirochaetia bacterium]|nr:four-carbon acid sugar kinase family protein [Spirochaetia bacterium]